MCQLLLSFPGDLKFLEIKYMIQNIREACSSLSCVRLRIKTNLMCALPAPNSEQHPKMQRDHLERNLEMLFIYKRKKKKYLKHLLDRNYIKECFKTAYWCWFYVLFSCCPVSFITYCSFSFSAVSLEHTGFFIFIIIPNHQKHQLLWRPCCTYVLILSNHLIEFNGIF